MDGMLSQEEINALLSGMDTTAAESAYEAETLSDMEKDIMGEIANISMGTAATTLSSLVNQKVDITTPMVAYSHWDELVSQYDRPCVFLQISYREGLSGNNVLILKDRGSVYAGSGRGYGIENFMRYVNDTGLAKAEGHLNAFGVIVQKDNLVDLLLRLDTALRDVEFKVVHEADVLLDVEQIDDVLINNFKAIDRISGSGFKPLTVMLKGVEDYTVGDMSKGKHLKLDCGGFLAIKWNYDGNWDEFDEGSVDMIGTLSSGYFGRTFYRQLIIQDYKVGDNDAQEI